MMFSINPFLIGCSVGELYKVVCFNPSVVCLLIDLV